MASADTVESYLIQTEVPHEQVDATTWVVQPGGQTHRIAIKIQDPIVLISTPVMEVTDDTPQREQLFRTLLELNAELFHASYGLQQHNVVLSGAQELENLDLNEFQAVLDDITMALDNHQNRLGTWKGGGRSSTSEA